MNSIKEKTRLVIQVTFPSMRIHLLTERSKLPPQACLNQTSIIWWVQSAGANPLHFKSKNQCQSHAQSPLRGLTEISNRFLKKLSMKNQRSQNLKRESVFPNQGYPIHPLTRKISILTLIATKKTQVSKKETGSSKRRLYSEKRNLRFSSIEIRSHSMKSKLLKGVTRTIFNKLPLRGRTLRRSAD